MNTSAAQVGLQVALRQARALLIQDPELAAEQAREILAVMKDQPDALQVLAQAHLRASRPEQAAEILQRLHQRYPNVPSIALDFSLACERLGRGQEAHALIRTTLKLDARLPAAWLALSRHLAAQEDFAGADRALMQHVRHSANDPGLAAAAAALHDNRVPEAERLLRKRLFSHPTDVVAIRMMAEVAARVGRGDDAEHLLRRVLELSPSFDGARQNLAMVLHRNNKPEQALVEVDRLLLADAQNPSLRNLKAAVLCRVGDYLPAIDLYDGLVAQYPDHARLWLSLGHALKTAGQRERAIAAYRRSIAVDPGFGEAWWSLANLKTFRFDEADLPAMQVQLQRSDLAVEQRAQFEFALGKAQEDRAEYAASFQAYAEGNRLRRSTMPYDADDASARVARSKRVFTREFFAERAGLGHPARDPIFVLGLPRAGSTLIEQILSSHSAIEGTMELPEIISITRDLRERAGEQGLDNYHDMLASLSGDELMQIGNLYLERTRVQRKTGAAYFIDKMPNNFFHIGLIHLALPNARIIDARRHPLACCFSSFKQYFARGQNFSYSLEDLGRYYRDYVELMAHFDAVLPGRIHRVIYENVVDHTEREVRALLDYCGLPFEDGCLRFFENERPVRTASSEQVRQPIYREGVDHWRHFEPWLEPLKQALGPVLLHYPEPPTEGAFGSKSSATSTGAKQ